MQPDAAAAKRLERIVRARTHLVMDEPFFGMLALRLKLVEDASCDSMWSDSVSLGYNPGYVDGLTDVELRGLIAKMVMHIAAGHPWRQDFRESALWQKAGTLAIYSLLMDAGARLPPGVPHDPSCDGLAAEAIYERLAAAPPSGGTPKPSPGKGEAGEGDDDGAGGADGPDDKSEPTAGDEPGGTPAGDDGEDSEGAGSPGGSEPEPGAAEAPVPIPGEVRPAPKDESLESEWKMAMEIATRMQGNLPLGVQQLVADSVKSTTNWREVLWQFFETSMQSPDYTWSRPNLRYMQTGFFMPSMQGSSVPAIVFVRDTSASIGQNYRRLMNGELFDILDTVKPEALYVLDVDAAVQKVQNLLPGDEEEFDGNTSGGGGTNFCPAFQWVEEQGINCCCLIYLTDLDGKFPTEAPEYPVLWAVPEGVSRGARPPFGEYLELELS